MLNAMIENKSNLFLRSWSQNMVYVAKIVGKRSKYFMVKSFFVFRHSIQHDEASSYSSPS